MYSLPRGPASCPHGTLNSCCFVTIHQYEVAPTASQQTYGFFSSNHAVFSPSLAKALLGGLLELSSKEGILVQEPKKSAHLFFFIGHMRSASSQISHSEPRTARTRQASRPPTARSYLSLLTIPAPATGLIYSASHALSPQLKPILALGDLAHSVLQISRQCTSLSRTSARPRKVRHVYHIIIVMILTIIHPRQRYASMKTAWRRSPCRLALALWLFPASPSSHALNTPPPRWEKRPEGLEERVIVRKTLELYEDTTECNMPWRFGAAYGSILAMYLFLHLLESGVRWEIFTPCDLVGLFCRSC